MPCALQLQMPCRLVPRLLLGLPTRPDANFDDLFQRLKPQACDNLHDAAASAIAVLVLLPTVSSLPAAEHADALCAALSVMLDAMRGLLRCGAALPPLTPEGPEALANALKLFDGWQPVSHRDGGGGGGGGQTASKQSDE